MTAWATRVSRLPLRIRLVAGFSAVMLVVLTAAAGFVYWRVEYALDRGLDGDLRQASAVLAPLVRPDGSVTGTRAAEATGVAWQVLSPDGTVLDHGGPAGPAAMVPLPDLREAAASGDAVTSNVGSFLPAEQRTYRVLTTVAPEVGPTASGAARPVLLAVGVRRDHRDEALRELLLQLGLAVLGTLALTAVVGDRLARSALLPVERFRLRAEDIAAGATGVRLEVPRDRDDEVTRLGHTLNEMLGALERAVLRERHFVDEASHELRTPLTLLTSRIQLARRRARSVSEHEHVLDELAVDVERLASLAEQLLALGSAEAAHDVVTDVVTAASHLVSRLRAAGLQQSGDLVARLSATPVPVLLDHASIDRILSNLISNAATYGRPPVEVTVSTRTAPGDTVARWAQIGVVDAGSGMPPELLASATQRFRRAPESRATAGAGLGLALVEALVGAGDGELRLCSSGDHLRHGTATDLPCDHDLRMTATVLLPLVPDGR